MNLKKTKIKRNIEKNLKITIMKKFTEIRGKISYKELDYFISEESNIYVLFEREDCKECKEFVPEFKKITKSFKTKIFYIDTKKMTKEEKVDCKKKYNVEYVPTILYFSNHKLKDTLIGQQPYDKLEDFVKGKQQ